MSGRPYDTNPKAVRLAISKGLIPEGEAEEVLQRIATGDSLVEQLIERGAIQAEAQTEFRQWVDFDLDRSEDRLFGKIAVNRGHVEPGPVKRFLDQQKRTYADWGSFGRLDLAIRDKGLLTERVRRAIALRRDRILVERYGPRGIPRHGSVSADSGELSILTFPTPRRRGRMRQCPGCEEDIARGHSLCPVCGVRLESLGKRKIGPVDLRAASQRIARKMRTRVDVLGHEIYPLLQGAVVMFAGLFLFLFFLPLGERGVGGDARWMFAWDLLGSREPFLAKVYVFGPLLTGLCALAIALGTRQPFPFGLGISICGLFPFVLLMTGPPHAYTGAFLGLIEPGVFGVLVLFVAMLVGTFLRIFFEEETLPRALGGGSGLVALLMLAFPGVLSEGESYYGFAVDRLDRSWVEGVFLLVWLIAPLLAATGLIHKKGWSRRIAGGAVISCFILMGGVAIQFSVASAQREIFHYAFVFLRMSGFLVGSFFLVSIGLAFVLGAVMSGRRRREELLVVSAR
ncbi:MAG: hypothetical protein QF752_05860 [Planctomycetota bacterium]|nr:hypothetical protein [Planctomycetota bacterium]